MLLPPPASAWITKDVWECLFSLMISYFSHSAADVFFLDEDVTPLLRIPNRTFYINSNWDGPAREANVDALFFLHNSSLNDVELWGRYGRVAVITDQPQNALPLWIRSRLIDTVILVPGNLVHAYTWFPYERDRCNQIGLKRLGTCSKNHDWEVNLYPFKVPRRFSGCIVNYRTVPRPPDVTEPSPGAYKGREVTLMNIIADSMDLQPVYQPTNYSFFFIDSGAAGQIRNGQIDFAFAAMPLLVELSKWTESLPVYRDQPIVWMFPKARPKDRISGVYSGLPPRGWLGVATILVICATISLAFVLLENGTLKTWNWLDFVAILIAAPINIKSSTILRSFLFLVQVVYLHLTWFYQSTLLFNLYKIPMEKEIEDLQDAVDAGLTAYMYGYMQSYFDSDDNNLWEIILRPGKHVYVLNLPFHTVVEEKTGFALSHLVNGAYDLRRKYRKDLSEIVNTQHFLNNPVSAYGYRGSPLTDKYKMQISHLISSGIFWHLTDVEGGYNDRHLVKKPDANPHALDIKSLQFIFMFHSLFCTFASLLFLMEVLIELITKYRLRKQVGNIYETRKVRRVKFVRHF